MLSLPQALSRATVENLQAGSLVRSAAHWIFLSFLLLVTLLTGWTFYASAYDDAYITFRYAENIARGNGFVYNLGEPFLGTTTPGYALLLAGLSKLLPLIPIPHLGVLISAASAGATGLLIYLIARRLRQPLIGGAAATVLLLHPLVIMSFGGEALFYVALVTTAYFSLLKKQPSWACVALALAYLVRADALMPAVVFLAYYVTTERKLPLKPILIFLVLISPWLLFSFLTFGSFVPSTLGAKMAQGRSGLWAPFIRGLWEWLKPLIANNPGLLPMFLFAPLGIVYLALRESRWLPFVVWGIAQIAAYSVIGVPFYHWYLVPIMPVLAVAAIYGMVSLAGVPYLLRRLSRLVLAWFNHTKSAEALFSVRSPHRPNTNLTVIRFAGLLLAVTSFGILLGTEITLGHLGKRGDNDPVVQVYSAAGAWFAENIPVNASIAYMEVGALGYYSRRRIVDLAGLVTPGVAEMMEKQDFEQVYRKYKPDYIVYNRTFEHWGNLQERRWFHDAYSGVTRISRPSYPTPLIVYQKKPGAVIPDPLRPDVTQTVGVAPAGEIQDAVTTGQTFLSHQDGLSEIEIKMATYARTNSGMVIFHLRRSPESQEDLVTIEIPADEITDNGWHSFSFSPLESKGKSYYFYLEAPQSKPGNAITVWTSGDRDLYLEGTMMRNGQPARGDLAFKTYASGSGS